MSPTTTNKLLADARETLGYSKSLHNEATRMHKKLTRAAWKAWQAAMKAEDAYNDTYVLGLGPRHPKVIALRKRYRHLEGVVYDLLVARNRMSTVVGLVEHPKKKAGGA